MPLHQRTAHHQLLPQEWRSPSRPSIVTAVKKAKGWRFEKLSVERKTIKDKLDKNHGGRQHRYEKAHHLSPIPPPSASQIIFPPITSQNM